MSEIQPYVKYGMQPDYRQILQKELNQINFSLVRSGTSQTFDIVNSKGIKTGWQFEGTDIMHSPHSASIFYSLAEAMHNLVSLFKGLPDSGSRGDKAIQKAEEVLNKSPENYVGVKFRLQFCYFCFSAQARTLSILAGEDGFAHIIFINHE